VGRFGLPFGDGSHRGNRQIARPRPLADADHVVLARADSGAALAWGRARGITLFAGRAVLAAG